MESGTDPSPEADQESVFNFDFSRYLIGLRKYVWLIAAIILLAIACGVVYTLRITPIYEAKGSVQIEPKVPDLLGTGDIFNVAAGANTAEYYRQQLEVLGSYTLCSQTIQQYDLAKKLLSDSEMKSLSHTDQLDVATRRLRSMIKITYPKQDRIMYVAFRSPDKQLATTIANDHIATYVDYSKGLLTMSSSEATDALQAEFNDAEAKLRAAEDKIYKFQADNDMIAVTLEEHQSIVSQNILTFTQKLNDATANEIGLAAKLAEMKKLANQDVLSTPIVMLGDNGSFETLRADYYQEKIKLIELAKELGAKNPDYLAQKEKVDELYQALQGEVQILLEGTKAEESVALATNSGLEAEIEHYKDEAKRLSPKIVEYNELDREKRQIEDQYNILRTRLSATQLTGSMSGALSNVHPLDPALLPENPVYPKMSTNVALAGAVGRFLGLGLVFLLVFLDRSIKTATDASQAAGASVLGVIPAITDAELNGRDVTERDRYVQEHPTSHVAECCRVLRTNIMFSAADHQPKTIVVCSANAKEGKTTTVIYLGTTMAQSGQRVLLVDTDMRRPRLHVSTGVSREPGLSNLVLGDDNYDELIKPTGVPNMFVLPCGPLPPNPAELLMTKRFEVVLAELSKRFSKVILDSPPLQPVTDAVVLAKRSEGVILVACASRTIRDELKRSAQMIRNVGGNVLGVVVNELDRRDKDSHYYYSYYGYTQQDNDPAA